MTRVRTFPLLFARQVDEQPSREPPEDGVVEVERAVRRADDDDVVVLARPEAVHLLHELREHAAVRDRAAGLARGRACAEERVDLVDEEHARREPPREREDRLDELLAFADVLRRCVRSDYVPGQHAGRLRTMSMTSEGETASIRQPASLASARTTRVLPVPGGPKRRHPVMECSFRIPCLKADGCNNGRETIVLTYLGSQLDCRDYCMEDS